MRNRRTRGAALAILLVLLVTASALAMDGDGMGVPFPPLSTHDAGRAPSVDPGFTGTYEDTSNDEGFVSTIEDRSNDTGFVVQWSTPVASIPVMATPTAPDRGS